MQASVKNNEKPGIAQSNRDFQAHILPGVSRTFALTITALPDGLAYVMTNAYLLCRIADTLEDDAHLSVAAKEEHLRNFLEVVKGQGSGEHFSTVVAPRLSANTPPLELELMRNVGKVVSITHSLTEAERRALTRCVGVMCEDMPKFNRGPRPSGLKDLAELDEYCYVVAGVVGEMVAEVFCNRCPELQSGRRELRSLAVSFGQGLQMTNILKDIWTDHERGACWLPQSVFPDGDFRLEDLPRHHQSGAFRDGMNTLIATAHGHLQNALEFVCRLPKREPGMRRFCLWSLGMAVLTLRKIHQNPLYTSGDQVKISRRAVRATVLATNFALPSNRGLRWLFRRTARGLPVAEVATARMAMALEE